MRSILYVLIFLVTLHGTLTLYSNSTFLGAILDDKNLALAYVASAIVTVLSLILANKIAARFGATRLAVFAATGEAAALVGMATLSSPIALIACFAATQALTAILFYAFDVFLESYTKDKATGGVRGMYLTVINAAFLIGPFLGTNLIDDVGFQGVYALSASVVAFVALAIGIALARFDDPHYAPLRFGSAIAAYRKKPDIALVTLAFFALWCFYVIAIVYAPIYLTTIVGLTAAQLGIVLTFGLIPFVLIQLPLGRLADSSFGEKEFMLGGFVLMAVTSLMVPGFAATGLAHLIAIIFIGRIGAAAVEVMCDAYFFKHVSAEDAGTIAVYRSMSYVAYVFVPLALIPIISSVGYAAAFPVAAVFAALGVPFAMAMRDTK